ncbi:MAG: 30S ribosomal protein S8 [Dehalococcoidales bacterium]|nr:30S ribosomal protein S8 [Dehalococcoidales bacterium]
MTISDPIADMLTRIRNAVMARHDSVLMSSSKMRMAIAKILKEEGFIKDFELVKGKTAQKTLKIYLRYQERNQSMLTGLERISKPGLRIYVEKKEIPRVYGGLGIAIVSTPKGLMTGHKAWKQGVGGELICYVW